MQTQLTISEVVNLPGVRLTRSGLVFAAQTPDEAVPEAGRRVHMMRGFAKWGMASVFAEMIRRRDGDETWANEFCESLQIDPKERREILAVHTFFPLAVRSVPLTYEHYREAMFAVSNGKPQALERALAFLRQAHAQRQTVSQMRLTIRRAEREEQPEPVQTESDIVRYAAVYQFRRFAAYEMDHLDRMTPERAALILDDLGEVPAFIDYLRQLAAKNGEVVEAEAGPGEGDS